jgi:HlyD family secretion protein
MRNATTYCGSRPSPGSSLRGRGVGCARAIAFIAAGWVLACIPTTLAQAPQRPLPRVTIDDVVERTVAAEQSFVGTVQPYRRSTVGSAVDGRVEKFLVNEGDHVEQDQPLVELRTRQIDLEIAAADAERVRLQQVRDELVRTRPVRIKQARARLEMARSLKELTTSRLERRRELAERNVSSPDDLQDALRASVAADQAFIEAEAAVELLEDGDEEIAQAQAALDHQASEVERLKDRLDKHTIRAPFTGYVVTEHTEVGHWIKQGDPAVTLVELDRVYVEAAVLESYVRFLALGDEVRVEIDALPDDLLTGTLELIVPQADDRSRSFPVKVRLDNRTDGGTPRLKPGMFARVPLPVGEPQRALLVPKDAVVLGGQRPLVYVVAPAVGQSDGRQARPVPVTLGVAIERLIQVHGELAAGDQVVVTGNERLNPGAPEQEVTIVKRRASSAGLEKAPGPVETAVGP